MTALGPVSGNAAFGQMTVVPEETQSINQPFCFRMKETAVWVWNVTWEKLCELGGALKRIIEYVVTAIRDFFAPKIEWIKEKWRNPPSTPEPAVSQSPVPTAASPVVSSQIELPLQPEPEGSLLGPLETLIEEEGSDTEESLGAEGSDTEESLGAEEGFEPENGLNDLAEMKTAAQQQEGLNATCIIS